MFQNCDCGLSGGCVKCNPPYITTPGIRDIEFVYGKSQQGWECPRISSTRYNVARHPMASIDAVYRRLPGEETFSLVLSSFYSTSEETKTIDGTSYTPYCPKCGKPMMDGEARSLGDARVEIVFYCKECNFPNKDNLSNKVQ